MTQDHRENRSDAADEPTPATDGDPPATDGAPPATDGGPPATHGGLPVAHGGPPATASDSPPPARDALPRWLRQLAQYLPICSQFVVEGNIRDVHLMRGEDGLLMQPIVNCLWELFRERGCEGILVHDRVAGIHVFPEDRRQAIQQKLGGRLGGPGSRRGGGHDLQDLQQRLAEVSASRELCCAFVIDYASRLVTDPGQLEQNEYEFFAACQKLADATHELRPPDAGRLAFNPVVWLADRANDLPAWFVVGNDRIRTVAADMPDQQARLAVAERLARDLPGASGMQAQERAKATATFASLSDGLTVRAMMQIRTIARSQKLPFAQIADAVRSYRVGIADNPWRQTYLYDRIRAGREEIEKSVKGQSRAVRQTLDILKRSVTGLTAAQSSGQGNKPRGVLFFAGPTGVGKTELAKAVTRLLFGDEQACIRFDMSEFSSEHTDARLIGAPPGYVGHDAGGELVNAVRQRPFSVVLFDEIEKAHPRILDKFLQILDDGRLSDGRGDTVYFSEAVIVFTSNLGVYVRDETGEPVLNVSHDDDHAEVSRRILKAIKDHFRFQLQRPELLNRIGDNIVVFDFIREELAQLIMDKMLDNVAARVREEHDVSLRIGEEARRTLVEECLGDLTHGGRGIGNRLEAVLVNPLARALFDLELSAGQSIAVERIASEDGAWRVALK